MTSRRARASEPNAPSLGFHLPVPPGALPSDGGRRTTLTRPSVGSYARDVETTRVDRWLWAVRLYKTRSLATDACRGGHVKVNGATAKPATTVKGGDRVETNVADRERVLEVAGIIDKRVSAAAAAESFVDHSPPAPPREERLA